MLAFRTDERFRSLLTAGKLRAAYYPVRGQEVVAGATMAALNDDDYLVTTYRGVHDQLAKGIPSKELWAEYTGKKTGSCKGKGGPMHMTHPAKGVMVTTGIVGSGLPIANGLALASQLNGDGKVTVASFGDGASNIGAFHESLNLAAVWNLPVVFLCQNNQYAEHTSYAFGTSAPRIVDRGPGYDMRAVRIDGNDAEAMYHAAREAVDFARDGHGPTLIEAVTFRMLGHIFGAANSYVPKEQLAAGIAGDPIPKLRALMLRRQFSEAELAEIDAAIEKEIDEAVEFAEASDRPDVSEIRIDVLAEEIRA
jgi:TPP-dependent pyruvate/acetoin dehydrogenase alpha subunit